MQISDEAQAHYSIYRTKLGGFAIGDALTDEQLLNLCRERGDDPLWFFVSHSSAPVHETSHSASSVSPTTVSTIPPPVLPLQNGAYGSLRPRSRSKHGSISSASERLPPEVGAGYEASVSDDLDIGERDSNRSTMRAAPSRSTHKTYPSSPDRGRRPSGSHVRPMSPLSTMRPSSPIACAQSLETPSTRADIYGSVIPTPPPAPPVPSLSPTSASFTDNGLAPPLRTRHARSGSDAAAEREQVLQASEDQIEQVGRQWQHYRQKDDNRGKLDRVRDRYASPVKTRGQRNKRSGDADEGSDRLGQSDSWVVIGNETPRATSKSSSSLAQDGQRVSPSILKDRSRLPYTPPGYSGRLTTPKAVRSPPPPPTAGAGDSRSSSSRTTAQAPLPSNWAVTWKVPDKMNPKTPLTSTTQLSRLTAKSMTDLRNPSHNGIPINMQPGSRGSNLPLARPERREGVLIPTTTYTDGPSSGRDLTGSNVPGLPKSYDAHRPPPRPLLRQGSSPQNPPLVSSQSPPKSYGPWIPPLQPPPNNYSTLTSPSIDSLPRPQSAMGNGTQRYQNRNYNNDQDDNEAVSPYLSSPLRQGGMTGRLGIGRDEGPSGSQSSNWHARPQPSETHGGSETSRTPPRTPVSPRSPRHSAHSSLAEPPNRHGPFSFMSDTSLPKDTAESVNSNDTVRQEDHAWIRRMLDGESGASATLIPKSVDIGQSPVPTQPPPPTQPLPPLPSQLQNDSFLITPYNPSQSTLVAEDDSESDDDDDLWQTKPTPRSPRIKSISRDKARGPPLTVQTDKICNLPPSFHNISSKGPELSNRPATDAPHSMRRLAPPTPNSGKNRQRGSTFTDNECTWAPRPAPEEVYERLEEFFPEHDLDKPVIEASSGSGSPTTTDNPAVTPLADKDRPEKGLVRAKKSIRIVAQEHKKRIDRTSRAENFASVLRKRSTKLWGSRLEEVTTEQAKAEQARALYAKPTPDSPSGGPRRELNAS